MANELSVLAMAKAHSMIALDQISKLRDCFDKLGLENKLAEIAGVLTDEICLALEFESSKLDQDQEDPNFQVQGR